jgi:2-methylisocitrate lyase-like PEP mutase family enzyme
MADMVRQAGAAGLSGCSIEDTRMTAGPPAYLLDLAVKRVRAALAAARALGQPFVLCARADGVMTRAHDLPEGIGRLKAFEAAGADLLFLPVPHGRDASARVLASVQAAVNALAAGALWALNPADFAALGVRRVSTGSGIARLTDAAIRNATAAMPGTGDFTLLTASAPTDEIDKPLAMGAARE